MGGPCVSMKVVLLCACWYGVGTRCASDVREFFIGWPWVGHCGMPVVGVVFVIHGGTWVGHVSHALLQPVHGLAMVVQRLPCVSSFV